MRQYPECACPQHDFKLRALVARNGTRQYAIWCLVSGWRGEFMPKARAAEIAAPYGMTVDDIPIHQDNRAGCCDGSGCEWCGPACERCRQYARVEYHHWAPRYLFDDAEEWPGGWLCRQCHQRWHSVVTPNMHMRRAG